MEDLLKALKEAALKEVASMTHEQKQEGLKTVLAELAHDFMYQYLTAMQTFGILTKNVEYKIPMPFKDEWKDDPSHFIVKIETHLSEAMQIKEGLGEGQ